MFPFLLVLIISQLVVMCVCVQSTPPMTMIYRVSLVLRWANGGIFLECSS